MLKYVLERPPGMPWLYYTRGNAPLTLTDDGIPTQFSFPDDVMNFRVHAYSLDGTHLGYYNVTNGLLQLCKNTQRYLNAAYTFGVTYLQTVSQSHFMNIHLFYACFETKMLVIS